MFLLFVDHCSLAILLDALAYVTCSFDEEIVLAARRHAESEELVSLLERCLEARRLGVILSF